jgi:hypothetical protein
MFIICKQRSDGTLVAGSPPKVHVYEKDAREEAERLAGKDADCVSFIVFKGITVSRKKPSPVETLSFSN